MKRRSLLIALISLPLVLNGCSTSYTAKQGYARYKEGYEAQIKAIFDIDSTYTPNYSWGSGRFVLVDKDQGTTGDDIYYYEITVIFYGSEGTLEDTNYFCWSKGDKYATGSTKSIFDYAYKAVESGKITGEVGTI